MKHFFISLDSIHGDNWTFNIWPEYCLWSVLKHSPLAWILSVELTETLSIGLDIVCGAYWNIVHWPGYCLWSLLKHLLSGPDIIRGADWNICPWASVLSVEPTETRAHCPGYIVCWAKWNIHNWPEYCLWRLMKHLITRLNIVLPKHLLIGPILVHRLLDTSYASSMKGIEL
jgi:hypothetical protein